MFSCPRCGGIVASDHDDYEHYYTCLMCGRSFNLKGDLRERAPINLTMVGRHNKMREE